MGYLNIFHANLICDVESANFKHTTTSPASKLWKKGWLRGLGIGPSVIVKCNSSLRSLSRWFSLQCLRHGKEKTVDETCVHWQFRSPTYMWAAFNARNTTSCKGRGNDSQKPDCASHWDIVRQLPRSSFFISISEPLKQLHARRHITDEPLSQLIFLLRSTSCDLMTPFASTNSLQ